MDPLVSIIIPVYMVEAYVERCLLSVIKQTYRHIEIIIVNGGYGDGTAEICRKYEAIDDRIIFIDQESKGLGLARDVGIDIARGEWICFVDGDDWIATDYVSELLTAVLENDCLMARCFSVKAYGDDPTPDPLFSNIKLFNWRDFWLYGWTEKRLPVNLCVWDKIYHRSLFDNLRFENFRRHEDDYFTVRAIYAARHKKIALVGKVLYFYYFREDSLGRSTIDLSVLESNRAMDAMLHFLRSLNEPMWLKVGMQHCLKFNISTFCELCRSLPHEYAKYAFIKKDILAEITFIQNTCPQLVSFLAGSAQLWEIIVDKGIILYGFGRQGKRKMYPWLKHFDVHVVDVWDKRLNGAVVDNRPIGFINSAFDSSTLIGISIEDEYQQSLIECDLRAAGYNNIIGHAQFRDALTYAKLTAYLPELLDWGQQS